MRHLLPLITIVLLCASCCLLRSRKSDFSNTRWTSSYEMFLTDVGTEKTTVTLTFGPSNTFVLEQQTVMPPYPSTYANADGTVDRNPGYTRTSTRNGTYQVKGKTIILTDTSGSVHNLLISPDHLTAPDLTFQELVFTRAEKQ